MPKYRVEIIVSYPCVLEANSVEDAIDIAENTSWDDWPDDDCEIVEYEAELLDDVEEIQQTAPPRPPVKSTARFTVIKGGE